MGFKEIEFGASQAEYEKSYSPKLLIEGFLDTNGYIRQIIDGNKFLILGTKGSGKSAIGSKLELMSHQELKNNLFVSQYYLLKDFPYKLFSEILPGSEAPDSRYPNHWEFLLLIALLNSYRSEPELFSQGKISSNIIELLTILGFLPGKSFSEMVNLTKTKDFQLNLKIVQYRSSTEKEEKLISVDKFFQILKNECYSIKPEGRHLIVIDGLDDILTRREKQYQSLMALIIAADLMNKKLKSNDITAKIVIMCRNDLFDRLSDPNKNKIAQDSSITLNWYQDVRDVKSTNLVRLINLRAKVSLNKEIDVFKEFFPDILEGNKPTLKVLLEYTRHTPRDFIQLINRIQNHTKDDIVTHNDIWNGINEYSNEYFQREIRDELHGFLNRDEDIDKIILLLAKIGKTKFFFNEIEKKIATDEKFQKLDITQAFELLYDCSAIGHFKEKGGGFSLYRRDYSKRKKIFTFKYRNPYSLFDKNQQIVVHKGFYKALNLRYQ